VGRLRNFRLRPSLLVPLEAHTLDATSSSARRQRQMSRLNREEYLEQAHYNALRGNELTHAKLNPALVREIRSSNEPRKAIANRLGVHYRTIEKVRQWETWIHVR